ncbi:MAG TPA: UDP-glucose/GDP-mannose dehydrogenase family protein [Phycisphaerae bacterium]|nr:UDP-glucose/GDP-mannose dehydrogenase family protein [Phycisphaerae bacterium]
MKCTVIGSGYVGLVTGVCLADTGNDVVGLDSDAVKVAALNRGECVIFEPGLGEILVANMKAGRLRFTSDKDQAIRHGDVIFIAVGTPPRADGSPDLTAIHAVGDDIAAHADRPKTVVIKSTVPVGTGDDLQDRMNRKARHRCAVVNNPEFLKEGSAVLDFQKPDRVIIGADDPGAAGVIAELHEPFIRNQRPVYTMTRAAAEMTKYAANACLATRISFINQIANICDTLGIDVNDVRRGIGSDYRIGFQFLYPGAGYGGSCFPKDVQGLVHVARKAGVQADLLESVHQVNVRQRQTLFHKIVRRFGSNLAGKSFAIWGVAFKPRTDDIREAPAVVLIEMLLEAGASVRAHDPEALDNLRTRFGDRVNYFPSVYPTLDGVDALAICTEWNEFRSPDFDEMRKRMRRPIIFDGRNLYSLQTMQKHGFEYHGIGRGTGPAGGRTS